MEKEDHELVTSRREREDAERDNLLKMLHSDIERLNTERSVSHLSPPSPCAG